MIDLDLEYWWQMGVYAAENYQPFDPPIGDAIHADQIAAWIDGYLSVEEPEFRSGAIAA